jgi:adenosylcobinamide kinase/adenosylcobinamide-phosphate guanylyltransferase
MQEVHRKSVTLVLGGVRSGKSRFALEIASRSSTVCFVATAQASDEEMRRKIERHRGERPAHWWTVEEQLDLARVIALSDAQCELVLIDCLTLFAANLMEAHGEDAAAIENCVAALCAAVQNASCSIVLVSNEVGSGIVPAYQAGRRFRDLLGELNQRLAAIANEVVLMVAGLPLEIKGHVEGLR